MTSQKELTKAALTALGIDRFVLAIHDVSFPSAPGEDIGRGSPYAKGGRDFVAFARELGFDGIQLGPQGQTSLGNPSPYDGSVFSKNVLSLALADLTTTAFGQLVPASVLEAAVRATPEGDLRAHYTHAFLTQASALALASETLADRTARGDAAARALTNEVAAFAARSPWLGHDVRFECFAATNGTDDWQRWPEADQVPDAARIALVEQTTQDVARTLALGQYLLDRQHQTLRGDLATLGMKLYGDMQVGLSLRDRWARGHLFLEGYRMGAPPSRTNPEGQPWGYPLFDPRLYQRRFIGDAPESDGPGLFARMESRPLDFVRARVTKLFAELDGVRIDHPHGLVCPWVYDATNPDPMQAVVDGARLFETPVSTRHPAVVPFAITRADQIDDSVPAYDDDHVRGLSPEQTTEYDCFFAIVMEAARAAGRTADDVLCEVLSTCPAPLACVMVRHGLGRFRVTQKASLVDAEDGYRGENAEAGDWTMLGNHDTPPLRAVVERWARQSMLRERATYLASRLEPDLSQREALATKLVSDPRKLARAMFAELFVGPATNVLVFFADLYGERATYNTPGLVSDANWSMRIPGAFREVYGDRRNRGEALDIPGALALAMRARGASFVATHEALIHALEDLAVRL